MFLYGNLTFDILCSDLLMLAIRHHVTKWELYLISILVLNLVVWDHVIFFETLTSILFSIVVIEAMSFYVGLFSVIVILSLFKRSIVEFIQ